MTEPTTDGWEAFHTALRALALWDERRRYALALLNRCGSTEQWVHQLRALLDGSTPGVPDDSAPLRRLQQENRRLRKELEAARDHNKEIRRAAGDMIERRGDGT